MDYKDTLLLPNTTFPMRANLPQNEQIRYKEWDCENLYKKMVERRSGAKESFFLHDGPPYANGDIHIGHALNKILKDIIVKYHFFQGREIRYLPGWDCHGLPIEQQVEKKIGEEKKNKIPKEKFRELCRKHADEFITKQMVSFKELGILGDFENPYKTMDFKFEADIYRALCDIAKKGLLKERSKPIFWSYACQTALAEAEVEYKDKVSDSIFVAFELNANAKEILQTENAKLVIWTTTPWTLPSNSGIALKADIEYILSSDGYIVASTLYPKLYELGVVKGGVIKSFVSNILERFEAINPLNSRKSTIVLSDHVSLDDGSGAVHIAPGHGEDDYIVGLKYDLDVIMPVDDFGCFDETIVRDTLLPLPSEFVGMHVFKANEPILEILGENLLWHKKITHSYPHCWRSHKPIIFRATKQWFILLDKKPLGEELTLRERALKEIESIKFYPKQGVNRLSSMIENRPDWCISRQRDWGVPIAFFRNKLDGEIVFDSEILQKSAEVFENEGADAWWSREIEYFLPKDCKFLPQNLEKVEHILDVWFDSGSTWSCVLNSDRFDAGNYPASMYLEGSDQHRGWFQSSLLVSCAINSKAPYRSILTHGFTVDENGEKMSKSKGNVVVPKDVLKEYGSEILRLWVAMSDYQSDLKISSNILKQISEQYRKIRNTLRFLLANIQDLESTVSKDCYSSLDRWILNESALVFQKANSHFSNYDFSKGLHLISHFVVVELSGIYLDICKDRLYCNSKEDKKRLSSQSAMLTILENLLTLLAPILTYSVDEALKHAPKILKDKKSTILDLEYKDMESFTLKEDFEYLLASREQCFMVMDRLKKDKKIKNSLELEIYTASIKALEFKELDEWFIVSGILTQKPKDIEILDSFFVGDDEFVLYLSSKNRCPRCWKQNVIEEAKLCSRCQEVVDV